MKVQIIAIKDVVRKTQMATEMINELMDTNTLCERIINGPPPHGEVDNVKEDLKSMLHKLQTENVEQLPFLNVYHNTIKLLYEVLDVVDNEMQLNKK